MVPRVQQVDDGAVRLGLGGEVGAGHLLQQLPLFGLALMGGVDARQRRQLDHVVAQDGQAKLGQQAGVGLQEVGIVGEEPSNRGRVELS